MNVYLVSDFNLVDGDAFEWLWEKTTYFPLGSIQWSEDSLTDQESLGSGKRFHCPPDNKGYNYQVARDWICTRSPTKWTSKDDSTEPLSIYRWCNGRKWRAHCWRLEEVAGRQIWWRQNDVYQEDNFKSMECSRLDIHHCQVLPGHPGCKQAEESGLGEPASGSRRAVPGCYLHWWMYSAAGVPLQEVHKHLPKIHIWGGISKGGATYLVMFTGIMNATKYGDILSASLHPFLRKHCPNRHRLYQDNDTKHTSCYIQAFILQLMGSTGGGARWRVLIWIR